MHRTIGTALFAVTLATGCGSTASHAVACRDPNPEVSIGACTALLESAGLTDSARAAALLDRGIGYRVKGDYDRAIADYDQAIRLAPAFANAYNSRGFAYQLRGNFERAIADYGEAIRLEPGLSQALKNRGRARFYLGRFSEAAADLRAGLGLDSTNAYVAIWLHMTAMRLGLDDTAQFAAQLALTDSVRWPAPVGRYYLGRLTADQLMEAARADTTSKEDQRCAAAFYIGQSDLWKHRIPEATQRFHETIATCRKYFSEYQSAVAELERLGDPPK